MIGKLKGIIDHIGKDYLTVDVRGVGYNVYCNISALHNSKTGNEITLFIETVVREDSITLFGFKTMLEKEWFLKLTSVKGVGNKMAQNILGILSPATLSNVIMLKDKDSLTQVSGVGAKLATRILTELKDTKLDNYDTTDSISPAGSTISSDVAADTGILNDAVSALTNLGYNRTLAYNIASKLSIEHQEASIGDLIRMSLKELSK